MSKPTPIPAIGLRDVALREAVTEYRAIIQAVRNTIEKAVCTGAPGAPGWIELDSIWPDSAVVEVNGKYWQYAYTLADDGTVTLGAPVQVVEQYVPVNAVPAGARVEADMAEALKIPPGPPLGKGGDTQTLIEAVNAEGVAAGTVWRVRAISAGLSLNGMFYPDNTLREAAPLFNHARVFEKSDTEHFQGQGKATKNLVGQLRNAVFQEGKTPDTGEIQADLHLLEASGLPVKLLEMWNRAMSGMVGFSIDAAGSAVQKGTMREAKQISLVRSLDLIVEPGAGGKIINLIEAAGAADMTKKDDQNITLDEKSASGTGAQEKPNGFTAGVVDPEVEALKKRLDFADMREAVHTSGLPEPVQAKLNKWIERGTTIENLREAITDEKDTLAKMTELGHVTGLGAGRIVAGESRAEKVSKMLDDFFDLGKPAISFRECYVEITGDKGVTGLMRHCDKALLREAAGADFREAVDSTTFAANILGDSITRALTRLYNTPDMWSDWQWLCDIVPLRDFRTNERTRMGGYGDLSIVAEGDPYLDMTSPGGTKETYAPAKRGGTEKVTLEAILNDDVGILRRIPQQLSTAAKRTLYKFVYSFLTANPTLGDNKALFHVDRGNLATAALDATSWHAARLAKARTAELSSNEPLGIILQHIAGPMELEKTAYDLFIRGTNLDLTFVQTTKATYHTVTHWTDANDWVATADKSSVPLIELGFISGNQEPELFVQDLPQQGSLFSNDVITYKIRHMYGGNVYGPDGFYKSVVP